MEHHGGPNAIVRDGLTAALFAAIGLAFLFFDPIDAFGAFVGAEAVSLIALALLLVFRSGNRRLAAAGLAFVAALIPTCEGVMIAHYPGGSPGRALPSSIPLVVANLVVMLLAALHFTGDNRRAMLGVSGVVVLAIGFVDALFR